jgi:hypothetical protein
MSSIIFGGTVSMLTIATPSNGWLIGYDTDGVLKQKDQWGIIKNIEGPTGATGDGFNTISNWGTDRIITSTGTNSAYAHDNLTFDGSNLYVQGTMSSDYIFSYGKATVGDIRITNSQGVSGSVLTSIDTIGNAQWKAFVDLEIVTGRSDVTDVTSGLTPSAFLPVWSDTGNGFGVSRLISARNMEYYSYGFHDSLLRIYGTVSSNGLTVSGDSYISGKLENTGSASFNNLTIYGYGGGAQKGKVLSSFDSNGLASWKTIQEINTNGLTGGASVFGLSYLPFWTGSKQLTYNSNLQYYNSTFAIAGTVSSDKIETSSIRLIQGGSIDNYFLKSDSLGNGTWASLPGGLTGFGKNYTTSSGTYSYLPIWNGTSSLTSSSLYQISGLYENSLNITLTHSAPNSPTNSISFSNYSNNFLVYDDLYSNTLNTSPYSTSNELISNSSGNSVIISLDVDGNNYSSGLRTSYNTSNGISSNINLNYSNFELSVYKTQSSTYISGDGESIYFGDNFNYNLIISTQSWEFLQSVNGTEYILRDFIISGTNSTNFFISATSNSVGIGTNTPDNSSILDLSSTKKGFLPPRMTATEAELINSPAEGLMIYSTDGSGINITSKGWWGYNGLIWEKMN